ncbi:MAG: Tol-Pal system beta propeller repeat protein TolB [Magnetococcales bacterium]|mgnify:CR=1 FL=1|nr:Tol-Pal system beta propeller repeat protein TolB [Magnetococcales bacterium]
MGNKMFKTIQIFALFASVMISAFNANAAVRINLTDPNADPLPTAIVPFDGETEDEQNVGMQMREVIASNLQNSGLFNVLDPKAHLQSRQSMRTSGILFNEWRLINAQAVMTGHIVILGMGTANPKAQVEFKLYDPYAERDILAKSYTADLRFWRHVAHRISDDIYTNLTGEGGYFTSRIVHIAEEMQGTKKVKKLCVMDQDGGNYQCLTDGSHLVLTPRFNPNLQKIVYMSYANGFPRLYLLDLPTGKQEIVGDFEGLNSSPRFSPDGKKLVITLTKGHAGNPEVYSLDLETKKLKRLTFHRGIDTSPSFSPDGKKIVFNSNRGGKPALYVMDADGNRVRRLTYGQGRHYAPVWSPRGDLIAFVKEYRGKFSINVVDPEGEETRQLTESFLDESPTWSPNGRVIVFARQIGDSTKLYTIDLTGYNERVLKTPMDASDPAWSPLLK